jgi:predicted amidohydrolase
MQDIRISAMIFRSIAGDVRRNIDAMVHWIEISKNEGAHVICFPELNITGYSNLEEIKNAAEPVPGPITRDLSNLSKSQKIVILAGIIEKDEKSHIFSSHLVIKPDGFVGVYRKLYIPPPEQGIFTPGNTIPLFDARGVKFGIQLCYDAHFPELSTHMAIKGADLQEEHPKRNTYHGCAISPQERLIMVYLSSPAIKSGKMKKGFVFQVLQ